MTEQTAPDRRLYLWVRREDIVFFQSNLEAEDGLARIRTERHDQDRSLILVLYSASREQDLYDHLRYLKEAGVMWDFVDSPHQESV